jgi:hypothetical protein
LNGTWDVILGSGADQQTATLIVSDQNFVFDAPSFHLQIDLAGSAPDVTYMYTTYKTFTGPLTVTHTGGPLSLGGTGLAVGGTWNLAGQSGERCNGEAHPDSMSVSCSDISAPFDLLRSRSTGPGVSTAQRRSALASQFGDLGGSWTVVTPAATCDVTFQGNTFNASCSEGNGQGSLELTLAGGLASGKTSDGTELSAKRR